ncbi:hypothetical protein ACOSQ3_004305 [Xanthoceras sorbifolium]
MRQYYYTKTIEAGYTSALAEDVTIHTGMKMATESGLLPAIVEFDSFSVINLIMADYPIRSGIGLIFEDILELKVLYGFSSFVFSPRANRVAYNLAKMALVHAIDLILLEEVPSGIRTLVQEEAIFSWFVWVSFWFFLFKKKNFLI